MEMTAHVVKGGKITFTLPKDELERLSLTVGDVLTVETTPEELGLILLAIPPKTTSEEE
jgi:hypothetical protein